MKWRRTSESRSPESSAPSEPIPDYGTPPPDPPPLSRARFYCVADKQARLASFRRMNTEWQLTWVDDSPIPEGDGGVDAVSMSGTFGIATDYPGCPGCSNPS